MIGDAILHHVASDYDSQEMRRRVADDHRTDDAVCDVNHPFAHRADVHGVPLLPAFTATSIGWSAATSELWAGDGDGKVHFLKQADFSEVGVEQGHSAGKAVTCICSSADGKTMVSGDSYRKLSYWDAAGRTKTASCGE